jgi:hypothetical protein
LALKGSSCCKNFVVVHTPPTEDVQHAPGLGEVEAHPTSGCANIGSVFRFGIAQGAVGLAQVAGGSPGIHANSMLT